MRKSAFHQWIVCSKCKRTRPHFARRLCKNCYRNSTQQECAGCGELKPIFARQRCNRCYEKVCPRRPCAQCAKVTVICDRATESCYTCYSRDRIGWADNASRRTLGRIRAESRRAARAARAMQKLTLRCRTCKRFLLTVRREATVSSRTKYCDVFCRNHNPQYREYRKEVGMSARTIEELAKRHAEGEWQSKNVLSGFAYPTRVASYSVVS